MYSVSYCSIQTCTFEFDIYSHFELDFLQAVNFLWICCKQLIFCGYRKLEYGSSHAVTVSFRGNMRMKSSKRSEGCTPFKDLTNTTLPSGVTNSNVGGSTASNAHPPPVDPRERKRQRDRDRYAQMPVQQKEELLKSRCENYQRKKAATTNVTVKHHQLRDTGDLTQPSGEISSQEIIVECTHTQNIPGKKCACDTVYYASTLVEQRQGLTNEQIESRRAKERAWYASMTPKQRQAIQDRQNARNMKPDQKRAKRDSDNVRRALRRNTLSKESITMMNPFYNPMEDFP